MACTISAAEIKRVKALGFPEQQRHRSVQRPGDYSQRQDHCAANRRLAQAAEKFGSGEVEFTTPSHRGNPGRSL